MAPIERPTATGHVPSARRARRRRRGTPRHKRPRLAEVGRLVETDPGLGVARAVRFTRSDVERLSELESFGSKAIEPMAFDAMPLPEGCQFDCDASALSASQTPPPAAPMKILQSLAWQSGEIAIAVVRPEKNVPAERAGRLRRDLSGSRDAARADFLPVRLLTARQPSDGIRCKRRCDLLRGRDGRGRIRPIVVGLLGCAVHGARFTAPRHSGQRRLERVAIDAPEVGHLRPLLRLRVVENARAEQQDRRDSCSSERVQTKPPLR